MSYENTVKIGDVVKSLDFAGVDNCYYIGLVTGVDNVYGTFQANIIKRVWEGKIRKTDSDFFTAALLGNSFFDDMAETKGLEPRIQVIA